MPAEILDLYFDINLSLPIVIVLFPAEDQNDWNAIYYEARDLIESLAGRINSLFFLGSNNRYPIRNPRDFSDNGPNWYNENRGRASLLRPVVEQIGSEFNGSIAIITSLLPIDIDDWRDTEYWGRMAFIRIGQRAFGEVIEALDNPVEKIYIAGEGFVPLCFVTDQNSRSEVVWDEGNFRLTISPSTQSFSYHIKALCPESPPSLYIKREKGPIQNIKAYQENQPWFQFPEWRNIDERIAPVIRAGILKREFTCSQCGSSHSYETFICPKGDVILKGMPLSTCILFKENQYLSLTDCFAYPLSNHNKVITKDGKLYELNGSKWNFIKEIAPYEEVDDGMWGLFHRI